jgi:hypothetical protein
MRIRLNPNNHSAQAAVYQIRLQGQLDSQWEDWFGGMTITLEANGDTCLTGQVVDQAALHGLLKKVRDLGLPLISVNRIQSDATHPYLSTKENSMNTTRTTTGRMAPTMVLSTLWIFAALNYLYGDVFTLFFMRGAQETTFAMPIAAVTAFAVLMEIALAMVLLSRVLPHGVNRWANIVAGLIQTALAAWSMTGSTPAPYTVIFLGLAIACTLFIIWYAWTWRNLEAQR